MTRLVFPDDATVQRLGSVPGAYVRNAFGASAVIYADAAGTQVADVQSLTGSPIAGALVSVDSVTSQLPLFLGPDGADTVYARVDGGPVMPLYARVDDRLDAIAARLAFSKALIIDNPAARTYTVWRATSPCQVTEVLANRPDGTGAAVNARVNGNPVLGVDLSVSNTGVWLSSMPVAPVALASGDTLAVVVAAVTGAPTQLTVQVNLAARW